MFFFSIIILISSFISAKVKLVLFVNMYNNHICNHTFPVYLISTSLIPAETADMHTDIENEDFRP